ncbi:hypothetical protein A3F06_03450 [candidate division TM6 bacterium RIFCSPHIGHO2_12_FULL_36_22]|nr:MAG: hypothetical protein A3F06_03450 [candidate division TM6 bacterium RIFCSPHIGHO2_12_FULL_36_22]
MALFFYKKINNKKLYSFLLLISLTIAPQESEQKNRPWKKYVPYALVATSGVMLVASVLILKEARKESRLAHQLTEQQIENQTFLNSLFNDADTQNYLTNIKRPFVKEFLRRWRLDLFETYLEKNPPRK